MPRWLHRFEIKPGSWVFVPDETSRASGRGLKRLLTEKWTVPSYYAHLRSGGHVAALKNHTNDTLFMRADIEEFFGHINLSRVTRMLKRFMPYSGARESAKESVVRDPENGQCFILPFGFVQSPIIASICLHQSALGGLLARLHDRRGLLLLFTWMI